MSEEKAATNPQQKINAALDRLHIELPSWGFANTGTRFGKFLQPGAATTIAEKFADAGEVHRLTGSAPTVALHVLWDLPAGESDASEIRQLERQHGIRSGSINPNLFQDQAYKFGSLCNPDPAVRRRPWNTCWKASASRKLLARATSHYGFPTAPTIRDRRALAAELAGSKRHWPPPTLHLTRTSGC